MTRQTDTCTPTRNSVGLPLENGALEAEGISSAPDALPLRGSPALRSRGPGTMAASGLAVGWLSADPADAALYREIGVLVEVPRIADAFIRRFEHARAD
jgi:hypothetical protein